MTGMGKFMKVVGANRKRGVYRKQVILERVVSLCRWFKIIHVYRSYLFLYIDVQINKS